MRADPNVDFKKMEFPNILCEESDVVEWEISDNISMLYDKRTQKFTIDGIDMETFDEYTVELDDSFDGMEIDGVEISKEDFDKFKELAKSA